MRFKTVRKKKELRKCIGKVFIVDDGGLKNEEKRSIWMIWKINLESLSQAARNVIAAFVLLGTDTVPQKLVERLAVDVGEDRVNYLETFRVSLFKKRHSLKKLKAMAKSPGFVCTAYFVSPDRMRQNWIKNYTQQLCAEHWSKFGGTVEYTRILYPCTSGKSWLYP